MPGTIPAGLAFFQSYMVNASSVMVPISSRRHFSWIYSHLANVHLFLAHIMHEIASIEREVGRKIEKERGIE